MRLKNTIIAQLPVAVIVCSLAIILLPATALASPGHGASILPDDPGQEEPSQHDGIEKEADMTENDMGADTTETTKSETKRESLSKEAKTAAGERKPAEKAIHDSAGEHYAVNATNTNGYPAAVGITLGALAAFGLALRYL